MSTPVNDSTVHDNLPEVELEPTQHLQGDTNTEDTDFFDESLVEETSLGTSVETQILLRQRLTVITGIGALFGVIRFAFSLFVPDSGEGMAGLSMFVRALFSVGLCALLFSRRPFKFWQLRGIEYVFVAVQAIGILWAQYVVGLKLIADGDVVRAVAFDKNCVIRMITMMMIYGVFIPNKPAVAARVLITLALGPILVLAALVAAHVNSPAFQNLPGAEIAVSNALFVILSAGISILACYMLNSLRTELRDARRLGQYELGEKLGEGGMGEVYMAEHELLKRPCALKLIQSSSAADPIARARFEREVKAAASLSHPNTIQIYDYGHSEDGTFYYVMEYLPGLSVADLVHQFGPLPPGRAIFILTQACQSLQEAHHRGMVHRDLKPANIFVSILGGKCDVAKVLDFGLVKVAKDDNSPQLTSEYQVSGTPSYMSPEQATGMGEVDGRTDIYALGSVLYFMLTGKPPFEKPTPMAVMVAHASEPVTPPSKHISTIPSDLDAVVLKCMAKKPEDRYPDTRALATALMACDCAADWDELQAEEWWLQQATSQSANPDSSIEEAR